MKLSLGWNKFVYYVLQYAPSCAVCLTFLPCGLVFGYTLSSLVAERKWEDNLMEYGPLILGATWALIATVTIFMVKFLKGRIIYWHFEILIAAGVFHLIASGFYFEDNFDHIGAFVSYLGHSLTFLAGLSFLHSITGKNSRASFLSLCFCLYLLGMASAVSLIGAPYSKNLDLNITATTDEQQQQQQLLHGIYVNFAAVYLTVSIVVVGVLIGMKVLNYFGTVDCQTSIDNELRIANSNGSIFDKREEIIKRIQFFYVTKNQQWRVSALLLLIDAIQYSIFIYFIFWFALNSAVRLTEISSIDLMLWTVFMGSFISTIGFIFVSVKITFVATQLCQIILAVVSMIVFKTRAAPVMFWLLLFAFGMAFSNLKICTVETSHFKFTEVLIFVFYILKLLSTSIVFFYFVANSKNSYFYSTDESTLMAQGFVFIIITALIALIVGMKVPRTHRTSLFDIQYGLLGIIFQKHQIEQLNIKWLNDGTIPTISRPDN